MDKPNSFVNRAKRFIDDLNADHSRGAIPGNFITRGTFAISFYDSVVVFEKGDVWRKEAPEIEQNNDKGTFHHVLESLKATVMGAKSQKR